MKKIVALTAILMIAGFSLLAQEPPPPPPDAGSQGGPVGGGSAPIGSGIVMLLTMGAGYAVKKVIDFKKPK